MLTTESAAPVMVAPTFAGEGCTSATRWGSAAVFACVRALVDAAILCPLVVYRRQDYGTRQRVGGGHLCSLLDATGGGVTGPALVAQLMTHLALWGECFIGKVKPTAC